MQIFGLSLIVSLLSDSTFRPEKRDKLVTPKSVKSLCALLALSVVETVDHGI